MSVQGPDLRSAYEAMQRSVDAPQAELPKTPPSTYGVERWRALVSAYFPTEVVDQVLRVMTCESSGNPSAFNGANYGLMQINAVHAAKVNGPLSRLYEPEENLRVAAIIWRDQGWGPWSCKP